jgi:membrane protease YdiL (CAAX protease family)
MAIALVLLTGGFLMAALAVQSGWAGRRGMVPQADHQLRMMAAAEMGLLAGISVAMVGLRAFTGASWRDLGLDGLPRRQDLVQGVMAFFLLIVPVYTLLLLIHWMAGPDGEHPMIEMMQRDPRPEHLVLMFVVVVIGAPVVEELLFRVMIQDWFRAVEWGARHRSWWVPRPDRTWVHILWGRAIQDAEPRGPEVVQAQPVEDGVHGNSEPEDWKRGPEKPEHIADTGLPEAQSGSGPFADHPSGESPGPSMPVETAPPDAQAEQPSWWPIVGSSILFAISHWGYNLDPIPLFALALGLGYLYQRTGRIYPCIVVHALVNLMAVIQMWLFMRQGAA